MLNIFLGVLIFIYTLLIFLANFTSGRLILEVLIIMLPYLLIFNLIVFLVSLLIQINFHKFLGQNILTYSLISLFLVTIFLSGKLLSFSYLKPSQTYISTTQENIKIAFFNKLYSNTNYKQINDKLEILQPDIIGLSELTEEDKENLTALKQYPYFFSKPSRDNATISVYSKFPAILNENIQSLPYVLSSTIKFTGQDLNVFVIHPLPIFSSHWIKLRDKELEDLATQINLSKNQNIILMGDFNLSPWSSTYNYITSKLNQLKNIALGQGINFTWQNSLLLAQIDHIFVSRNISIEQFKVENMEGSDHNLIWTNLKI